MFGNNEASIGGDAGTGSGTSAAGLVNARPRFFSPCPVQRHATS